MTTPNFNEDEIVVLDWAAAHAGIIEPANDVARITCNRLCLRSILTPVPTPGGHTKFRITTKGMDDALAFYRSKGGAPG